MRKPPRRARRRTPTAPVPPPPAPTVLPIVAAKPWYHAGLRFGCTGCGACCRREGYVWLGRADIARLADRLGLSIEEFRAAHTREVAIDGQDRPGVCLTRADHGCIFLDDATNQCTVHDARPAQCRIFPFWPRELESEDAWQDRVVALCGREAVEQGHLYTADEILALAAPISGTGTVAPVPRSGPAR